MLESFCNVLYCSVGNVIYCSAGGLPTVCVCVCLLCVGHCAVVWVSCFAAVCLVGFTVVLVMCFAVARVNLSTDTCIFQQYGVMCVMQCVWYDVIPFWWGVCPQWVVCFG